MFREVPLRYFLRNTRVGEKLKARSLKGSFDKRMRVDLPVPLPVPTPPRTLPTPFPFSLISFHRKTTPHHSPEPDPKPLLQGHQ